MFTFDGVTSATMGINVNYPNIPAMPTLNNMLKQIDGKEGLQDFGALFNEKYISFDCNFLEHVSRSAMMTTIDNLNKYLDPKNGLKILKLDDTPDRQFYARLYQGVDISRVVQSGGRFTLTFICPDPYAYELTSNNQQYTANGIYSFSVGGNTGAYPILTIVADIQQGATSFLEFNFNNTDILKLKPVMETTHKLVIDCANRTAKYINITTLEESNGLLYIDKLAFPLLKTGSNDLEISESSSLITITSIDIDWYDRFI